MNKCERCKEYSFWSDDPCKCTKFEIKEDYTGDVSDIYADDHHQAALRFAKEYNAERILIDATIGIKVSNEAKTLKFDVSAVEIVDYSAEGI